MGLVHFGVHAPLTLKLKELYDIKCFVETGTYMGKTSEWASQHFEQVYTIEGSEQLWLAASQKYQHVKNIRFLHGDSPQQLAKILPEIVSPTIFWLDAHWCGGQTFGQKDTTCPLIEELRVLNQSDIQHFILIDDARLFTAPPPKPHNFEAWPTIGEVITEIGRGKGNPYTIIFDDVIVSVPTYARTSLAEFYQEHVQQFQKRLSSFRTKLVNILK